MKNTYKILLTVLTLSLTFFFAGCGGSKDAGDHMKDAAESTGKAAEDAAKATAEATEKAAKATADAVEKVADEAKEATN